MKIRIFLIYLVIITSLCFAEGASYLIITHDNFYAAIQPLAKWKQKKGIPTKVVKLSEIGATPTNITLIKNYIINAYNTWTPRPEYILLVGNGSYIKAENDDYDDYYANVTGDYRMDISLGRFPVTTSSQCSVIVSKTLSYERTPFLQDTTWYRKGTTIVREDGTTHPDTVYWNNVRYAHSLWINAGYTNIDSLSYLRGSNSTTVMNAINNGRAYVLYRGTATVNWYNPFQQVNPSNMTNGFRLPIIVSATCATMSFFYTDYLGNRFMNAGTVNNPKGSIAFLGSTISASGNGLSILRGTVSNEFFNTVFNHRNYKLGDAVKRAKFVVDSIRPPYFTTDRYREWNLFGDPELNLWTSRPRALTVQHDSIIQTIPQNFLVSVRNNSQPVSNALVCIMMDTLVYKYGYTNTAGNISFFISPNRTGSMSVTATAQNFVPYEKNISVISGTLNHDVGLFSLISPTGTINSGTLVIPGVKVKNYGISLDTFMVSMNIGSVYNETVENVVLAAGDTLTILLPVWTAIPGNYPVIAYTDLAHDQFRHNDTATNYVTVNISNDIGISNIINPDSTHPIDSIMTPKAKVKNYGVVAQTNIPVTCSIINSDGVLQYANTQTLSSLAANESLTVIFNFWTPHISQLCTVKFKTYLINDENTANDQKTKLVFIFTAIEEQTQDNKSLKTALNSVKPNPINNHHAKITFSLSKPMHARLKIYNVTGCVIKTLIDNKLHAGSYTYYWDIRDQNNNISPRGIYFCTLQIPGKNYSQKIILTK